MNEAAVKQVSKTFPPWSFKASACRIMHVLVTRSSMVWI